MEKESISVKGIKLFAWLYDNFGDDIKYVNYRDLGVEYGKSYEAVRIRMLELEKFGYLKIIEVSRRKRRFILDKGKIEALKILCGDEKA
jgi:hypothetical protein